LTSPPSRPNYHPAGNTPLTQFPHKSLRHLAGGLAITITVLAMNMIGDAVRDVLDPETRE